MPITSINTANATSRAAGGSNLENPEVAYEASIPTLPNKSATFQFNVPWARWNEAPKALFAPTMASEVATAAWGGCPTR